MAAVEEAPIVVLGGGIVGAAVAYFLAELGETNVVVLERCAVACAASGKAGGFLARGWGDGSPTERLHHAGFALHAQLAQELNLRSYRALPTLSAAAAAGKRRGREQAARLGCDWLDGELAACGLMDEDTAQVTPLEATNALMAQAQECGVCLRIAAAAGVRIGDDGRAAAVLLEGGEEVAAREVIVALGPWSVLAQEWFPGLRVPMEGIWSSSLVLPAPAPVTPFAVFSQEDARFHTHLEIYPRPGDEGVYVCGLGGSRHLAPAEIMAVRPEEVLADEGRVQAATEALRAMAPALCKEEAAVRQACMRPCPQDGRPMLGRLSRCGPANVTLATGTNCWGITWAPAIGKAIAELLVHGKASTVSLGHFDPERFSATGPRAAGGRGRHQAAAAVGEQW